MDFRGMYGFLEQGEEGEEDPTEDPKKKKGKKRKKEDGITLPDREGASGDGNKSGLPRSPGTAAGDKWGAKPGEVDKETKKAQAKYKGNFDKEEMRRLAGIVSLVEETAKVTKSDAKYYYVDVPGHGEVKIKKGNLLGVGESGLPADVILKALKAAGKERSKEQKSRWAKFKKSKKVLHPKKPKSRSMTKKPASRSLRPKK